MFYCSCFLASADYGEGRGWAGGCSCSCCEKVVVGREAAGANMFAGAKGCGVSICSSSQICCWISLPVAETTDGGLKCFCLLVK